MLTRDRKPAEGSVAPSQEARLSPVHAPASHAPVPDIRAMQQIRGSRVDSSRHDADGERRQGLDPGPDAEAASNLTTVLSTLEARLDHLDHATTAFEQRLQAIEERLKSAHHRPCRDRHPWLRRLPRGNRQLRLPLRLSLHRSRWPSRRVAIQAVCWRQPTPCSTGNRPRPGLTPLSGGQASAPQSSVPTPEATPARQSGGASHWNSTISSAPSAGAGWHGSAG